MEYLKWRLNLFGHPPPYDPCIVELSDEFHSVPLDEAFDHMDRMLIDHELHTLFSEPQLALGLSMAYSNCFTDLPFCYSRFGTEDRRIEGILNLKHLYDNFFARYCTEAFFFNARVPSSPESMQHLCENFWDRLPLYPCDQFTLSTVHAAIDVMQYAISCQNEHCVASGLSGLAIWSCGCEVLEHPISRPTELIAAWLESCADRRPELIDFGRQMFNNAKGSGDLPL